MLEFLNKEAEERGTDVVKREVKEWLRRLKIGYAPKDRQGIPREWVIEAWERQGRTCARCGRKLSRRRAVGDHKIALAHGGKHVPENIAALEQAPCNSSKGSRTLIDESKASGRLMTEILR
jgi:5-methylcytosine-specific restriction endonuclease McrA